MQQTSDFEDRPPPAAPPARRRTLRSLAGLAALCGWVFFLGVLVGRGSAPVEFDLQALESKLLALREQILQAQEAQLQAYSEGSGPPSDLEFYEALKGAQEAPRIRPDTVAEIARAADAREEGAEDGPTGPGTESGAGLKRPRSDLKPKPSARAAAGPPAQPPAAAAPPRAAAADGPLVIQVASLQEADRADQMVQRLRSQGFNAYKLAVTIPGKGVWYRIRVGSYGQKSEAAATLKSLEAQGLHPILVPR